MDNTTNENSNRYIGDNMGLSSIDISQNNQSDELANRIETGRNPDGTFKKGFSGNLRGRPKDPVRQAIREEFYNMSKEKMKEFINTLSSEYKVRHTEGNPPTVLAGDQDNPIKIITVDKDLALMYGINITSSTETDSDRQK